MPKQTAAAVTSQLSRILDSNAFAGAERVRAFLEFVVTETVQGRQKFLKAYTIALEVLGRDVDFDPSNDSIVRVEAGRLRDRLARYYYDEGRGDPIRIEIPKGGYAPIFSFSDTSLETPAVTESDALEAATAPPLSIGVLPFANMSDDPNQKYFCDGVVEEINSALLKFTHLRVAARSALIQNDDGATDIRSLASGLNLRFVLEGSVRRQSDRIRVTAKLIKAADGTSVWAGTYDRNLTASNLFEIQDDVAANVAAAVAPPTGAIASHDMATSKRMPPEHFSAYDAVLAAYEDQKTPNFVNHKRIRGMLEEAVRSDPNYAEAWALLSVYYLSEHRFELNRRDNDGDPLDRALAAARRSIAEARGNALAWKNLSKVHYERCEFDLFREAGERAVTLNPAHPDVLVDFGAHLWLSGDCERGVALVERALELTPQPPGRYYFTVVHEHFYKERYEEALTYALKLNCPGIFWQHLLFAAIYGKLGRIDEAKMSADTMCERYPNVLNRMASYFSIRPQPPGFFDALFEGLRIAGVEPPK